MNIPRGTDIDVDGMGHIYATSWAGGGFAYSGPKVGYVIRLSAPGAKPAPFPDLRKATDEELAGYVGSLSGVCRLAAQRERSVAVTSPGSPRGWKNSLFPINR